MRDDEGCAILANMRATECRLVTLAIACELTAVGRELDGVLGSPWLAEGAPLRDVVLPPGFPWLTVLLLGKVQRLTRP